MNPTTKWNINKADDATIKKLKSKFKTKGTELTQKLSEIDGYKSEKARLEGEKSAEIMLNKLHQEQVEILDDIAEKENIISFLESKTVRDKWNGAAGFSKIYDFKGLVKAWTKATSDLKYSNKYDVSWKGENYSTDVDNVKRMIGLIAKKIEKIDATDFKTKITSKCDFLNSTAKTEAERLLKVIQDWCPNFEPIDKEDPNDSTKRIWKGGREMYTVKKDSDNTQPNFPFGDFFRLILLIAPKTDYSFIKSLDQKDISKKQEWFFQPIEGKVSEEMKKAYTGYDNGKGGDYYIVDYKPESRKKITIEKGLEDYIDLFYSVFTKREDRMRYTINIDGDSSKGIPANPWEKILDEIESDDFKAKYSAEYTDLKGKTHEIYLITDVNEMVHENKTALQGFKSKQKIKEDQINEQNKIISVKNKKVLDEEVKIDSKETEIGNLIAAEISVRETELVKTDFTKSDFVWTDSKNILKAIAAKYMLEDIRWLQNNGDDNKPFQDIAKKQVYDEIVSHYDKDAWSAIVKDYFQGKGSTTAERVKKIKSEETSTWISLQIIRDIYAALPNNAGKEVVDAIDAETPTTPPQTKLTPADLDTVFGITGSTAEMVTKWEGLNGEWGKKKENIEGVIKPHLSDSAKKTKLIKYINDLPASEGIDKTSDDTKLSSFFKKEPSFIVNAIVAVELKDNATKTALITRMKEWKTDGDKKKLADEYFDSNGEPTDAGLKRFLYEEKIIKNHSTKDVETTPSNGDDKEGKGALAWLNRNYWWPVWGSGLLIVGTVAIFWKQISEWWNGPTEEGGETEGEKEEENE